jgi:hypothetical protein
MAENEATPEEQARNKQRFEQYADRFENHSLRKPPIPGQKYACPCCGYLTLDARGASDICPVCFWEDDGQDNHDADVRRGGPNGRLSLTEARKNFREFGACELNQVENVRKPRKNEEPR